MAEQWYVYIMRSIPTGRLYVGVSEDVDRRHGQHERGNVWSTKAYRPWKVVYVEGFATKREALQREHFLKSHVGWLEKKRLAGA